MTTSPVALPVGPRAGQATQIEQSRAAAEVFAAVLAAKQAPRDLQASIRAMHDACKMRTLAERAFFRFNRGGQNVTGPTVHLARELARCWGNVHHAVNELARDDIAGQSEMQALAWDLEGNTRSAAIFIVPHARDTKKGRAELTELRDIYENNANNGARRLREAIYALLPVWFVEEAKDLCVKTLEHGGGKPLPQRIAGAIELFAGLGVSEQRLVTKVGRPSAAWTALDLAPLTVIYQSISRGEVTVDQEFPPEQMVVTLGELAPAPTTAPAAPEPAPATRKRGRGPQPADQPAQPAPPTEADAQVVADFSAGEQE